MRAKNVEWDVMLSGCWHCTSHKPNANGYPRIMRDYKVMTVAKFMWIQKHGNVSTGLWVLHKCDNRLCINPAHLYLGTYLDNMKDRALRGRSGNLKLSNSDVLRIRELINKMKAKYLALFYNVDVSTIYKIWRHSSRQHI